MFFSNLLTQRFVRQEPAGRISREEQFNLEVRTAASGARPTGFKSWLRYLLAWESCSNLGESPHLNSLSLNRIPTLQIASAWPF